MKGTERVELLLREPVYGTHNGQQSVVARRQELDDDDYISDFDVGIRGKRLDLDADDRSRQATATAREKYRLFGERADEHGCCLEPAFTKRTMRIESSVDPKEVVDRPIVCLALYDDLRTVLPCADGDDIYTVGNGLDALEDPDATVPDLEKRKIGTL